MADERNGDFGDEFAEVQVEFEADHDEGTELLIGVELGQHGGDQVGGQVVGVENLPFRGQRRYQQHPERSVDRNLLGVEHHNLLHVHLQLHPDLRNLHLNQ